MTRVRRTVRNALLAGLAVFLGLVPAGRDFVRAYAEGRSSDQTAILAEYGESTPRSARFVSRMAISAASIPTPSVPTRCPGRSWLPLSSSRHAVTARQTAPR